MDPKFLKEVEQNGWRIEKVTDQFVIGRCPSVGCALRAKLDKNASIPPVDPGARRNRTDITIDGYDALRVALRSRREEICLTIKELEEIAGAATDHLAKAEKDQPTRIPNAMLLLEWIQALGYEVVLRPGELPAYTRRVICDTRNKYASRTRRFSLEQRRRGKRS